MTAISTNSHVDTTIDMAIDDTPSTPPRSTASNATNPAGIHTLKLKFEFRAENQEFNVQDVHRELLFAIANECPNTSFHHNDKNNNDMFDPFVHDDDTMKSLYNYKFLQRSNHFLACVAHSIKTQANFDKIKSNCKSILDEYNGYVPIHKWDDEDLDIATAGWILESNPTTHNRDYIYKLMNTYCKSFNETFHPIELQSKTISFTNRNTKNKISSQAIHILCRRPDF